MALRAPARRSQWWTANTATVTRKPHPALPPGASALRLSPRRAASPSGLLLPPEAPAGGSFVYDKFGAGVMDLTATGQDSVTSVETGMGVTERKGSGADVTISAETGLGVSPRAGSGADAVTAVRAGTGISARTGGGAKQFTASRSGTGVTALGGSGQKASEYIKSGGTAGYPFPSTGLLPSVSLLPGVFGAVFTGSGASQAAGSTYVTTGAGTSVRTGSGADSFVASESNQRTARLPSLSLLPSGGPLPSTSQLPGILPGEGAPLPGASFHGSARTGSGAKSVTVSRTGMGVSARVGSALAARTYVRSGLGVTSLTGSGSRAPEHVKAGTGVMALTGRGSRDSSVVTTRITLTAEATLDSSPATGPAVLAVLGASDV